jgi:hypothetical protein
MSVGLNTLERINTQLKEAKNIGVSAQNDLYTHLTQVFNKIMLHHREDGFDRLEEISQLLKQTHCQMKDPASDQEVNAIKTQQKNPELTLWLQRSHNLLSEHWDAIPSSERDLIAR